MWSSLDQHLVSWDHDYPKGLLYSTFQSALLLQSSLLSRLSSLLLGSDSMTSFSLIKTCFKFAFAYLVEPTH